MSTGSSLNSRDFQDTRPIEDLEFGAALADRTPAERQRTRELLTTLFRDLGCQIAQDVADLGCTGLSTKAKMSVGAIAEIRNDMAGSGVGITCFVPGHLFCLAHNTIGALQPGQAQRYPEALPSITRPLTPQEEVSVRLIEKTQRIKSSGKSRLVDSVDMLSGRGISPADLEDEDGVVVASPQPTRDTVPDHDDLYSNDNPYTPWMCDEHDDLTVGCRYCLAEAIVTGPLEPFLLLMPALEGNQANPEDANRIAPDEFEEKLAQLDAAHCDAAALFVKVATWRRRLARD